MRAILVCVDFSDLLAITIPYNRHHFEEIMVVTAPKDTATQEICRELRVKYHITNKFYDDGAQFNKWKALEQGLDVFGRHGQLCIMDVDVLWPKAITQQYEKGYLYSPLRRMMTDLSQPIPTDESLWKQYPLHQQQHEWAGFTQIFHAEDTVLGPAPWHETNWKHAGGADSFFQKKWPAERKIRPNWEVLHLGEAGRNWCGRVTGFLNGTAPAEAAQRYSQLRQYLSQRQQTRSFNHEKIS